MRKKLLFFLLFPVLGISQVQIGQDIDGEAAGDQSGSSVSLSSDGSIVAIGTPFNDGNGNSAGHVRIFQNISGIWTQIGDDIDGEAADDYSGSSVSLSSDGSIVAIGARQQFSTIMAGYVRVFQNISGVWTQIGDNIDGEAAGDASGWSVSLSSDGTILAIGAPRNNNETGHVRIYENLSGVWTQIGSDINGEAAGDWSGYSVSLSSDGNTVAIGAPNNSGNGTRSGHVRIYKNISGVWTQIGTDIEGEAAGDFSGRSVSLSSDGKTVAIGALNNSGKGAFSGHVRILQNISGVWTQIGDDIDGEAAEDFSGRSVSLSSSGDIVVIGSGSNGNANDSGHVRVFQNISGVWTQIGTDIDGEAAGDWSSYSISLSSDEKTVAIGAPQNSNGNGNAAGHVRVYDISNLSSNDFVLENFNIYPNPTSDLLNISLENNLFLEKVTIYNNAGQVVKEVKETTIDVSSLSNGIYFVEVTTNQGKAVKKIIVK